MKGRVERWTDEHTLKKEFAVWTGTLYHGVENKYEGVMAGFQPLNRCNFISEDLAVEFCEPSWFTNILNIDGKEYETAGYCGVEFMFDEERWIMSGCHVIDHPLLKGKVKAVFGYSNFPCYNLKIKKTPEGPVLDLSGFRKLFIWRPFWKYL
ncbi:MAG: hypothetical protein ACFFCS_06830 [Candidatus Hodarchaeota archaeon]